MAHPESEKHEASRMPQAARDRAPEDALALAISAHVASYFHKECAEALELFDKSLALNPNSQLAWGLSGITLCYVGEPKAALDREAYALRLSPFDPLTFYFTGISGFAAIRPKELGSQLARRAVPSGILCHYRLGGRAREHGGCLERQQHRGDQKAPGPP